MRQSYLLVVLPAVVGAALAAYAYVSPGTGVTGTGGALLALIGAVGVAVGGIVTLLPSVQGGVLGLLNVLLALGAILTAVAAWFLMQTAFAVMMALVLAGLLLALVTPDWRTGR